jgi:lipopolysaccharide transport system ATP-binding protein
LLDGLYHFSVAVVNNDDTEIFDYHDRGYSFRVSNDGQKVKERFGLMTLRGEWCHTAGK